MVQYQNMDTLPKQEQPGLQRYARQMVLPVIGSKGQKRLSDSRVTILGVGALGTNSASLLARAGVGFIRLADRDYIDITNLNRQNIFDEEDILSGYPKAVVAAKKLSVVNSTIRLEPRVVDINTDTIEELIKDVDLVLDGSDNFELRYLLNDAAIKLNIPWIYAGIIATHGMTMPIFPGSGPCFRCFLPEPPAPGSVPTCETAGVLGPAPLVVAGFQAAEAIKFLSGNTKAVTRKLHILDVWNTSSELLTIEKGDKLCPACDEKRFDFLQGGRRGRSTSLCGRNAVQILPSEKTVVDLASLAGRLSVLGVVQVNEYMLTCRINPHELVCFADGRAIIKGTEDPAVARSLYSKYIGQ